MRNIVLYIRFPIIGPTWIILLCIIFSYLLNIYSVEYEIKGQILYESFNLKYSGEFMVLLKDNKWYFKYWYYNTNLFVGSIEAANDGRYLYCLSDGYLPYTSIKNVIVSNDYPYRVATIKRKTYFREFAGSEGGDIIWISFCSQNYFSSLTNNMIVPFFSMYKEKESIPADIIFFPNSSIIRSLEYTINKSLIRYDVLQTTRFGPFFVPYTARAVELIVIDDEIFNNVKYATNAVYYIKVISINPFCKLQDFKPILKDTTQIYDLRFDGFESLPLKILYYSTNWLSDTELTNHPAFITEYKRHREIKKLSDFIQKRTKYGRIAFFTLFFISTIPLGYLIYRYKIRGKRANT